MDYFPEWYHTASLPLSDGVLDLRIKGVQAAAKELSECEEHITQLLTLCRWGFDLPERETTRRTEVSGVVSSQQKALDSAFRTRDNDLEMRVLTGATIWHLIEKCGHTTSDLVALAVICAPLLPGKDDGVAQLLQDLKKQAAAHIEKRSRESRQIVPPEKVKTTAIPANIAKTLPTLKAAETHGDAAWLSNVSTLLSDMATALGNGKADFDKLQEQTARLAANQSILEEETDILWWLFAGRSRDLKVTFATIDSQSLPLVMGKELADSIRFLPGHRAAREFLMTALDPGADLKINEESKDEVTQQVRVVEAVGATPTTWRNLWKEVAEGVLLPNEVGSLCPLSKALDLSLQSDGDEWIEIWQKSTGLNREYTLGVPELAEQFFNERLLCRAVAQSKAGV